MQVVAVAARTPVGLTAESCAAAVRAGISRLKEYPWIDPRGQPIVLATDARLDRNTEARERMVAMVEHVLAEACAKLDRTPTSPSLLRVLLALPETRPGFSEKDASWVLEIIRSRFRPSRSKVTVELAGRGHAGAVQAVAKALARDDRDAMFLIVGADSHHHVDTFQWLDRERRLARATIRNGFVPGEGAGCIALASVELVRRLQLARLAIVRGAQMAQETQLRESETGSLGVAMSRAVEALHLPNESVDAIYLDLNGERYRSEEWGFVALRASRLWKSLDYFAPADSWGDIGAAFGALAAVLAVQSFVRRYSTGPRALILAGSESGSRGAMLIEGTGV